MFQYAPFQPIATKHCSPYAILKWYLLTNICFQMHLWYQLSIITFGAFFQVMQSISTLEIFDVYLTQQAENRYFDKYLISLNKYNNNII